MYSLSAFIPVGPDTAQAGLELSVQSTRDDVRLIRSNVPTLVENLQTPAVPKALIVQQNYPNPFNPSTIIEFDIPSAGVVSLTVFDLLGRQVATLVNDHLQPGRYLTAWDAAGMPSGVYCYRL